MKQRIAFVLKLTSPVFIGYLFLGFAFGILMSESGYAVWWTALSALTILSGSMQLAMVSMLVAGTPLISVALTTFLINSRYLFYGFGVMERIRSSGRYYWYMIFGLTDETYSILSTYVCPPAFDRPRTDFEIAAFNQSYWIFGCVLGALVGRFVPLDFSGVDFCATAFFVTVVVDQWEASKTKLPVLIGAGCGVLGLILIGPQAFLFPTLLATVAILFLCRRFIEPHRGGDADA